MLLKCRHFLTILSVLVPLATSGLAQDNGFQLLPPDTVRQDEEIVPKSNSSPQENGNQTFRPQSRVQSGFPEELILKPPTREKQDAASRFVQGTIDPHLPLNLVIGRPKVLQLAAAPKKLYVPSKDVIKTEIIDDLSGKEVAITGLKEGTTTLIFWFEDPQSPTGETAISYLVRVFTDPVLARPIEELAKELNRKFPNSYIELDQIENRMIVRGQTPNVIEMSQILQVLAGARGIQPEVNRPADSVTLTNTLNFQEDNNRQLDNPNRAIDNQRLFDSAALIRAGIINQLKVVGEQQVMLKVTVAEVNRTAARSIGLNFRINNNAGTTIFQTLTGGLIPPTAGTASTANAIVSLDAGQTRLAVEALRRLNLSKTLAEPNLVAMNGESADFQAGGRFPVPVISSGGNVGGQNLQGVNFIPFGVELQFRPIIQDGNTIRLQLNAEVSTRDESLGTAIGGAAGGTQVTGLNSRNFSTTVQLRSGQTIAVAGLMQTNSGASSQRIPIWGDLPFLGWTGGVNRNSSGEQELVILVTPHLVSPLNEAESLPVPGNDVFEPTDIEFFIANRLESRRGEDFRSSVQTDYARIRSAERNGSLQSLLIGGVGPTDRLNVSRRIGLIPNERALERRSSRKNETSSTNRNIGG